MYHQPPPFKLSKITIGLKVSIYCNVLQTFFVARRITEPNSILIFQAPLLTL